MVYGRLRFAFVVISLPQYNNNNNNKENKITRGNTGSGKQRSSK
jgi:hypothetical protein